MSIGRNIKRRREEKGLTQEELATAVCVSRSTIAQIERDSRCPSMILGEGIAAALGCRSEELMETG